MRKMKTSLIGGMVSLLLCAALPAVADVTVGLPADLNTGNCFPFACAYSGEYQQVYTSSAFPGSETITGLEFFNTSLDSNATSLNSGNFVISLSTTSANWNSLASTFASNIGPDHTTVFNGNIGQAWTFGDTLSIHFAAPYTYKPANGNLLMDVEVSGASAPNGNVYFDTNGVNSGALNGDTIMGRVYEDGAGPKGHVNSGYGLITGFVTDSSAVPEPSSIFLIGAALAGIVAVTCRRRASRD